MANYFAQIAAPQIRNAEVDFSGLNSGIDAIANARQMKRQNALEQRQMDMREQEFSANQAQRTRQATREDAEMFGRQAAAIDRLQGPQRAMAYQRLLAQHPNRASLTPEYLDPVNGPKLIMAEAGQFRDPMADKMQQAELAYKQAQTSKLYADAKDTASDFGKTGTVVKGADGNYYTVRYNADGTERINRLEVGGQSVTPDRGTDVVGDTIIDKATGANVRNVGSQLAAGEQAKVIGRESGERQMGAPKAAAALESANVKSDVLLSTIERARALVGPRTTGLPGAVLSNVPGTAARDLSALTDTLKANAGFQELQTMRDNSPTGGALGQVAVQELAMLQATITSLEQAQSGEQFLRALDNFETFVKGSKERRRAAYEATYGGANQPQLQGGVDLKSKYGLE